MRKILGLGAVIVISAITCGMAHAQTDHYVPGSFNIRDFATPDPGFYGALYNYWYSTNDLRDANGKKINSVTITGPGGKLSATVNLSVNVHLYALAPALIWVPKKKILGAKYEVMLYPSFANASLGGLLSLAERSGQSLHAGQFNIGDTYVSPVWLDWGGKHYDAIANYGFYIPTGKYSIETVNVPVVGPVRVASSDNTGLGFGRTRLRADFTIIRGPINGWLSRT
ncbi:MAG TPA: transporter [Bryobacteraceae bacterium]|nr:transporter [Bryobacteraceae bacterium]